MNAPQTNAPQTNAQAAVVDVVTRNCGYGFSGYAVMSDGSQAFHTTHLHPTREQAHREVVTLLRVQGGTA